MQAAAPHSIMTGVDSHLTTVHNGTSTEPLIVNGSSWQRLAANIWGQDTYERRYPEPLLPLLFGPVCAEQHRLSGSHRLEGVPVLFVMATGFTGGSKA